jgi:hypothetical protein
MADPLTSSHDGSPRTTFSHRHRSCKINGAGELCDVERLGIALEPEPIMSVVRMAAEAGKTRASPGEERLYDS